MRLRADLHVHSKFSKRPTEWLLRKIGCAESYTEPKTLYRLAKERGMDIVTVTDHNSLIGSLEIAHLEGTFVSEEITAYFPEDRCKLHVLAYDITEAHHEDISRLRENIRDLVRYLNEQKIVHALAHPFYAVNERLTPEHLDEVLLLFKNFELNGSRDAYQNELLRQLLENLTKQDMERLSDQYDMEAVGSEPWKKNLIRGSDDHSSLRIGRAYTEVENATGGRCSADGSRSSADGCRSSADGCLLSASSVKDFLTGLQEGRVNVGGEDPNPKSMAQTIYSVAYQFYKTKFQLDRFVSKDLLLRFADRALTPSAGEGEGVLKRFRSAVAQRRCNQLLKSPPATMKDLLQKEAAEVILEDSMIRGMIDATGGAPWKNEEIWFRFVDLISEKVLKQFADSTLENLSGANLFDIFQTIGSAASLYALLSPYFVGYTFFTRDRRFCENYRERFRKEGAAPKRAKLKVAHFTDTFYDVNGVAKTLRMMADTAIRLGKELKIVTCGSHADVPGVVNFSPIGTFSMPEYPEMKLYYPPLLKILDYCYRENFTHIHCSTPGPLGLAGFAVARILKLPLYGTYHTALPQYANLLTDDAAVGEIMWKYSVWFYNQMDVVYVPSVATGDDLCRKGVRKEKIMFYPRGIDVGLFHPSKRNGFLKTNYGVNEKDIKLLYVGRVSKEKNMPLLSDVYRRLVAERSGVRLIVVGNGPYLEEMKSSMKDLPVTFTGFLTGEDLAQAYASSDLFVFPSTTDTFGNVVLEAQASGLPVIVTDEGGPKENIVPGKTGIIVPGQEKEAFVQAMMRLVDDPTQLEKMRLAAREHIEHRTFDAAFLKLWESYRSVDPYSQTRNNRKGDGLQ